MCGRICCGIGLDDLSCATSCKNQKNTYVKTKFHKSVKSTAPSFNVPPTASIPVLVSAQQNCFKNTDKLKRFLVSMRFGLIPSWMKSKDVTVHKLETHLCKLERLNESKLYKPLFEKGYRCAVPCIGYYEWQTSTVSNKQPYFFFNKENSVADLMSNLTGTFNSTSGWTGIKLLYLAGIFSTYTTDEGTEAFSFAIITRQVTDEWKWVHHRMPVVLQSDNDVDKWIDMNFNTVAALDILNKPINNLQTHPVDKKLVNNTRNNSSNCIFPIDSKNPQSSFMSSWLTNTSTKNEEKTVAKQPKKRTALETWLLSDPKKQKQNE